MSSCGLKVLVHMSWLVKCSRSSTTDRIGSTNDESDENDDGSDECAYDGKARIDSLENKELTTIIHSKDANLNHRFTFSVA